MLSIAAGRERGGEGKHRLGSGQRLTTTTMDASVDSNEEVSQMTMHSQLTKSRKEAPLKAMGVGWVQGQVQGRSCASGCEWEWE